MVPKVEWEGEGSVISLQGHFFSRQIQALHILWSRRQLTFIRLIYEWCYSDFYLRTLLTQEPFITIERVFVNIRGIMQLVWSFSLQHGRSLLYGALGCLLVLLWVPSWTDLGFVSPPYLDACRVQLALQWVLLSPVWAPYTLLSVYLMQWVHPLFTFHRRLRQLITSIKENPSLLG